MKTLFTFLATFFLFLPSNAQEVLKPAGGGGGFTIGYGYMNISALHDFLPDKYPSLMNNQLLMGGMGYGFKGNFIIGGGGTAVMGDTHSNDSVNVSLGGGYGTFNFGYILVNKNSFKMFPMLGLGGGGYGISITDNSSVSVDEIKKEPFREINISNGGFLMELSLHFDFLPNVHYDEKEGSYGGFLTGLQLGYVMNFPNSNWSYQGGSISDGPNFMMNMFYAKLIIGGIGMQ